MYASFLRARSAWYAVAVLLGCFTGCSCESEKASLVNPEGVHQIYTVTYNGDAKSTTVNARFRFGGAGGTNLELDGVAKVTHNVCEFKKSSFLGVNYAGSFQGHQAEHIFEYTDTAGKLHRNTIRLPAVDFGADAPAEISRSKDLRLAFVGDAVGQDESVEVSIHQANQGNQSVSRVVSNRTAGARDVLVSAAELGAFAEGDATLTLTRRVTGTLQSATTRGGSITANYVSDSRKVKIVK